MEDIRYFYMYYNETENSCPYCGKELNDLKPSGEANDFYRCPNCKEDFRVIRCECEKDDIMKVWITKNALTEGIQEENAKFGSRDKTMIEIIGSSNEFYHNEGDEWHLTKESAIRKANDMIFEAIVSLNNEIKRLEDIDFE